MNTAVEGFAFVYSYRSWNPITRKLTWAPGLATLEVIRSRAGMPILQSARKVPRSQVLDGQYVETVEA